MHNLCHEIPALGCVEPDATYGCPMMAWAGIGKGRQNLLRSPAQAAWCRLPVRPPETAPECPLAIVPALRCRSLLAMSVPFNSASAIWNAPIPRDTETAQAPRKHRSKLKRSTSRIATAQWPRRFHDRYLLQNNDFKILSLEEGTPMEIEFVAMVSERSGGISLGQAKWYCRCRGTP